MQHSYMALAFSDAKKSTGASTNSPLPEKIAATGSEIPPAPPAFGSLLSHSSGKTIGVPSILAQPSAISSRLFADEVARTSLMGLKTGTGIRNSSVPKFPKRAWTSPGDG